VKSIRVSIDISAREAEPLPRLACGSPIHVERRLESIGVVVTGRRSWS
jgi:hypothetical protein